MLSLINKSNHKSVQGHKKRRPDTIPNYVLPPCARMTECFYLHEFERICVEKRQMDRCC